jgi:DNA-binding CsgD family transcriptional regulator
MEIIKFDETKKIWHQIAKHTSSDDFCFELEVHKKLLNIFHVGEFYYYVFNCSSAVMEFVSEQAKEVLGIEREDELTIEYLLSIIHPEDFPYFIDFEKKVTEFFNQLPPDKVLKYKVTYDYRVKRKRGDYIRLFQQVVTIQSEENGAVIRVLGVHTDITHIKKENGSTLSFIGLEGEPSYHDVSIGHTALDLKQDVFTKREKEILKKIAEGKKTKEIAEELFISTKTVDTHRKNMLGKTNTHSILELVLKYKQWF